MNYSLLMLAIIGVGSSTAGECLGGVCDDRLRESSVLMQRLNRKGRQMPLKVAKQATPVDELDHKQQAADLYEVAVELLKANNTTKPVLIFVEDMLRSLEEAIFPALQSGYENDKKFLEEALNVFHVAESTFHMQVTQYEQLVQQEQQASHVFQLCRDDDEKMCDVTKSCETERVRLWDIYEETKVEYQSMVAIIKHKWCEVSSDRSDAVWRESMELKFERFITIGQEHITKLEAHDEWVTKCEETNHSLFDAVAHCAERKRHLEETSCQRLALYNEATSTLDNSWRLAKSNYESVLGSVKGKECYRAQSFKYLQAIKCVLEYLIGRCDSPYQEGKCDAPEGDNEISRVLTECMDYHKTNASQTISSLIFPSVPVKPEKPDIGEIPCSEEYVSSHYAGMDGQCFASMPGCLACGENDFVPDGSTPDELSDDDLNHIAEGSCGGDLI